MLFRRLYERYMSHQHGGVFRQIPLPCPGRLFVSPMPYGAYDPGNRLLKLYRRFKVQHVFMLVTEEELRKKARRKLPQRYAAQGMTHSQYPLKDLQVPALPILNNLVAEARNRLQTQTIAVHCHAGVGRTAVAVACVAQSLLQCSTEEALNLIQNHMNIDITTSQRRIINEFHNK